MSPIFTTFNQNGLSGYSFDEFIKQFDNICKEHIVNKRAKKFAFIIFEFESKTYSVLQNQGVFTELDRLSGKNITLFYLYADNSTLKDKQNRLFKNLNSLVTKFANRSIQSIPFILFFDFNDGEVGNFNCYRVRDDEKFILSDLSIAISKELESLPKETHKTEKPITLSVIKETTKILYSEFIELILDSIKRC